IVTRDHVLPLELVRSGRPGVPARPAGDRPRDVAARTERLPFELTEDLVAALVGPHAFAHAAGEAVREPDDLALEADAEASLPGEQQRSGQADDGGLVPPLEAQSLQRSRGGPRPFERARFAGRRDTCGP